MIYVIVSLLPTIISHFRGDKNSVNPAMNIVMCTLSLFITIKAPIGLGLYFIASSIFSLVEGEFINIILKMELRLKA